MAIEQADAIVLRIVDFSESSLIVTLFTRELGKIGIMAKGARRPKNPFDSALDLLARCRIVFLRKSSDALDLLTEAKLVRRFRPAARDLSGLYAGYYVAELLDGLTDPYQAHPELFELADRTLTALATGEAIAREVLHFELNLLHHLGLLPSLDRCVECGMAVPLGGMVSFGHLDGGVLCRRCRAGHRQVAAVRAGTLRAMVELSAPEGNRWRRMEMDARSRGELRGLLNQYIANLLGHRPRMHQFLSVLSA